jgi:hypothetical protein
MAGTAELLHSNWAVPASPELIEGQSTAFADPDSYPLADRGVLFSMALFSAKHLGDKTWKLPDIEVLS